VEVRGYLELRTTFTDGSASRTENIRVSGGERPFSVQHFVGQAGVESAKRGVVHPPHEDEAPRLEWKGDRDQVRSAGS